jgi:hypothetical protein
LYFLGRWGFVDDEVVIAKDPGATLDVIFDYVLWKIQKTDPTTDAGVTDQSNYQQPAPLF